MHGDLAACRRDIAKALSFLGKAGSTVRNTPGEQAKKQCCIEKRKVTVFWMLLPTARLCGVRGNPYFSQHQRRGSAGKHRRPEPLSQVPAREGTTLDASRCVYYRKVSENIEKYRKKSKSNKNLPKSTLGSDRGRWRSWSRPLSSGDSAVSAIARTCARWPERLASSDPGGRQCLCLSRQSKDKRAVCS